MDLELHFIRMFRHLLNLRRWNKMSYFKPDLNSSKMRRNRTSQSTELNTHFFMSLSALLLFLAAWLASKWTAKHLLSPDLWNDKSLIRLPSAINHFCKTRWKLYLKTYSLDYTDVYNSTIKWWVTKDQIIILIMSTTMMNWNSLYISMYPVIALSFAA